MPAVVGLAIAICAVLAIAPASGAVRPGWGAPASFLGRYRMMPQGVSEQAPEAAGIFATAVSTASRLLAIAQTPTHGQMTVFMRTVKKTEPPAPSGILSVVSPAASYVLYLTDLTASGTRRAAVVNGGSFLGPIIGTFTGTFRSPGQLIATVRAAQFGTLDLRFARFSANPEP